MRKTIIVLLGVALPACAHQRGYAIEGNVSWKPTRIYSDGPKTVIEVPRVAQRMRPAPALLVQARNASPSGHEPVTYRIVASSADTRYVVDGLLGSAVMIAGFGDAQERVDITRLE